MQMFNPPHPGESLHELYFRPLNLDVSSTAAKLAIELVELNQILNGKRSVTPTVAIKLAKAFDGTAFSWLNQ